MTNNINDGGPAFPVEVQTMADGSQQPIQTGHATGWCAGLSVRDWFAGQALAGLMAHPFEDGSDFLHDAGPDAAAYQAYRMADAMIAARTQSPESQP